MLYDTAKFQSNPNFPALGNVNYSHDGSGVAYVERNKRVPIGDRAHPFKITTSIVDGELKYQLAKGSIQDGTNGTAIDLTGIIEANIDVTTAGYVVIEATVAADLTLSDWATLIIEDVTDTDEVKMTTADPLRQEKLRLLIGKITLAVVEEIEIPTIWQAWFTSARVSHGFLNGSIVRVFESAPTEASKI